MGVGQRLFVLGLKTAIIYSLFLYGVFWAGSSYASSLWQQEYEPRTLVITFEPFVPAADVARFLTLNGLIGNVRAAMRDSDYNSRAITITANVPIYSLKKGAEWKDTLAEHSFVKEVQFKRRDN